MRAARALHEAHERREPFRPLASGLALESHLFAALFATADKAEGMAAFIGKRKPDFTGR